MNYQKKKRRITIYTVLFLVFLVLALNVSVDCNTRVGGGTLSVALDKLPVLLADHAIVRIEDEEFPITDSSFIWQLKQETLVADRTDLCVHSDKERWIDLYHGEKLVRHMRWTECSDGIIVYTADNLHWLPFSTDGNGIIDPSNSLLAKLKALTGES